MLFRRRQKSGGPAPDSGSDPGEGVARAEQIRIDFDMMLKGSVNMRRGKPIRQYGVTVNGATRLITSGDVVDRKTYDALVAAGAVKPVRHSGGADGGDPTRP